MVTTQNIVVFVVYTVVLLVCRLIVEQPRFPMYLFLFGLIFLLGIPGLVIGCICTVVVPFLSFMISDISLEPEDGIIVRPWTKRFSEKFKTSKLRKFLLK